MPYLLGWAALTIDGSTTDADDIDEKLTNIPNALKERLEDVLIVDATADPWVLQDTSGGPVTAKRLLIPGSDFQPTDENSSTHLERTGWIVGGGSNLLAPLKLPPGVTITLIEAMVTRNANTTSMELYRYQHAAVAPGTPIALLTASTSAGGVQIISSGAISITVADDYYYIIGLSSSSGASSFQFAIHGVRVTYNTPSSKETI